jgi:phosphoglycolate phosphatase-like HAD superfamily hydrolase
MNGTPEEEGLIHQWAKSDKELYKKIEELETELKKAREEIAQLSERLYNEQTDVLESDMKLDKVVKFLDSLFADGVISRPFRFGLAEIRCELCCISECSTRNDPEECLRMVTQKESKGENLDGLS